MSLHSELQISMVSARGPTIAASSAGESIFIVRSTFEA